MLQISNEENGTYLNSVVGNWFPVANGWVSVTVEMFWGICAISGIITFPWDKELFTEVGGFMEIWDCTGCELIEVGAVVFGSPLTSEDQMVKSGKVDGGWTFDNKFPGNGFIVFGDCLGNVEVKLLLADSKRKVISFMLTYLLFLPVFFIISNDDSPFESSCNIFNIFIYYWNRQNKLLMFICVDVDSDSIWLW